MIHRTRKHYALAFVIGFAKIAEGLVAVCTLGRLHATFKVAAAQHQSEMTDQLDEDCFH